jgi:hypothetical protein
MTKTTIVLVAGGSFVLGCLVGGGVVFSRSMPPMAEMMALTSLSHAGNEAYVKYRYGSYPVAKTALLQYADLANSFWAQKGAGSAGALNSELGLTYDRLALAAERAGHADEAAQYMKRAQEALSKSGDSVDESRVRTAVERLDRAWDRRLSQSQ